MPENNKTFINPYNFVPMGDGVKRSQVVSRPDETHNKTGYIECTLHVKTPIAIPNTDKVSVDLEKKYKIYSFYKRNDKYMISGSQLRGMIRNVYEAFTDSCFSVVTSNLLSKRDGATGNPGIITFVNGEWHLYEAVISTDMSDVEREWNVFPPKIKKFGEYRTRYYKKTREVNNVEQLDRALDELKTLYELYGEYSPQNSKIYDKMIPKKDGDDYVVFYFIDKDKKIHLTPSQISRRIYNNRVKTLLGSYSPCTDLTAVCPACALFGFASSDGNISSSVRFEDAVGEEINSESVILKELASPKLTSLEFYSILLKDYDKNTFVNRNMTPWNYDSDGVMLRGRKFYFHNPAAENNAKIYTEDKSEATLRNSEMEIVKKGHFSFRVYYNNISENELKTLLWVLSLGENTLDSTSLHKIGHGKPIGLGSVKVIVNSIFERSLSKDEYTITEQKYDDYQIEKLEINCTPRTLKALKIMCSYDLLDGQNISYPIGIKGTNIKTSTNSMQWFSLNHGTIGSNVCFQYILHPVVYCKGAIPNKLNEKLVLPMLESDDKQSTSEGTRSTDTGFTKNKKYGATVNNTKEMNNGKIRVYINLNGIFKKGCSVVCSSPCNYKKGDRISVVFINETQINGTTYYNFDISKG